MRSLIKQFLNETVSISTQYLKTQEDTTFLTKDFAQQLTWQICRQLRIQQNKYEKEWQTKNVSRQKFLNGIERRRKKKFSI